MLRLGLLREKAAIIHHVPDLEDDADTRPEELAEAAVLHGCHPSVSGRPVLDVPGGAKKNILVEIVVDVIVSSLSSGSASPSELGGPQEKMSFFQIASGPILSIPFHLKVCQYCPCKVSLKKMTPSLPTTPPKSAFFGISDWTSD